MFATLSERLTQVFKKLGGRGQLTPENIQDTLREIRIALLEADVALPVVRDFISHIQERAMGVEVTKSLTPDQVLIKLVHEELVQLMGETSQGLELNAQPPVVILMAGLQGSGKTTTVAKLARWLKQNHKKNVMVASADVYRPAAIQQLQTLAEQVEVTFFPTQANEDPVQIAHAALQAARTQMMDVLILDTAGRLHIDDEMMLEIQRIHEAIHPIETLFTVDSMTGQDAANTAKAFNDALPLTGVILTKTDGDARGGAALSVRHITGKPIRFMGIGEKMDAIELFHPDRVASRILGMGDILTLVEEAERKIDRQKAEKLAKKIRKGKTFNLEDFRDQLREVGKLGGVANIMGKLPGMGQLPQMAKDKINDRSLKEIEAIINSMTPKERRFPMIINGSRKRRIAMGSGTDIQAVNRLLKQFTMMQKMMKKLSGGGIGKLMRSLPKGFMPGMGGGGFFPK
ncbi:MAG: signal recognition particle protein [Gammaproteobacteria bacterium]|nr:signal recognition particle protein [Gammaproteobacteria bacterium]